MRSGGWREAELLECCLNARTNRSAGCALGDCSTAGRLSSSTVIENLDAVLYVGLCLSGLWGATRRTLQLDDR